MRATYTYAYIHVHIYCFLALNSVVYVATAFIIPYKCRAGLHKNGMHIHVVVAIVMSRTHMPSMEGELQRASVYFCGHVFMPQLQC